MKPIQIQGMAAGAAITPYSIVKIGAANHTVILAAAATDNVIGVTPLNAADAAGDTVDVIIAGIAEIKLAGTVARGAHVASNAAGLGIATTTAGNVAIGTALASGVTGDIIPVLTGKVIL